MQYCNILIGLYKRFVIIEVHGVIKMTDTQRRKIISVLISSPTRKEACERLGITERTLYNYMHDEVFQKEYQEKIEEIIKDSDAKTKEAGLKAINHLISVIEDQELDAITKIKADRLILEHLAKMIDCENKYW